MKSMIIPLLFSLLVLAIPKSSTAQNDSAYFYSNALIHANNEKDLFKIWADNIVYLKK